jgi:uncharacterized protein YbjT (DUF2867 family)
MSAQLRTKAAEHMNLKQIKVLLSGASGMVGTAVLRECLADPQIVSVATVGRSAATLHSSKLREGIAASLSNHDSVESSLRDATLQAAP